MLRALAEELRQQRRPLRGNKRAAVDFAQRRREGEQRRVHGHRAAVQQKNVREKSQGAHANGLGGWAAAALAAALEAAVSPDVPRAPKEENSMSIRSWTKSINSRNAESKAVLPKVNRPSPAIVRVAARVS